MRPIKRWFLPRMPDLLALLRAQAEVTTRGFDAFVEWSSGNPGAGRAVRDAEHEADDVRRELLPELRAAFSTPLEPEDIYELSERLDAVLNQAKNVVREAEVMNVSPNAAMAEMAAHVRDGVRHVDAAFGALASDGDEAIREADAATKCERNLERSYRTAMSELLAVDEIADVMARRELYRRYARLGESLAHVAERIWYSEVKKH